MDERTAVRNYHHERHHPRLGNRLIAPKACRLENVLPVRRRQRLIGVLNYYYIGQRLERCVMQPLLER